MLGFVLGVVLGSVPFAWLLFRVAKGGDLRREGSGNPGATNLTRLAGWTWGVAALALDAGKGALAVLLAKKAIGAASAVPAAMGAVLGHVFSPWLRGRGGKGVATAAGAFLLVAPSATGVAAAVFALVVGLTRFVSAASVAACASLPLAVMLTGPSRRAAVGAAAIFLLIAWRHRANFARMRHGTEPRIGRDATGRGGAAR